MQSAHSADPLVSAMDPGAHGAHSVSFVEVRLGAVGAGEEIGAEIVTGGRDGRLCVFALEGLSEASGVVVGQNASASAARVRLLRERRGCTAPIKR